MTVTKLNQESKVAAKADDQVKIGEHHKADVYVKAAKRYKDIMSKYLKREKLIPFHYSQVYCSPFNRRGAPLNMKYVWEDLIPNMIKDGVDSSRPKPGFVVDRAGDEKALKRLCDHNQKMRAAAPHLYPPYEERRSATKEAIGGNHMTVSAECFDRNMVSPIKKTWFHL